MRKKVATTTYKSISLINWNFAIAVTFLVLAVAIAVGWQTPAVCYQLTSVFGATFLMQGLLGTTSFGSSKYWQMCAYFISMLLIFFAMPLFIIQLALGQRGSLVGSTYYVHCAALFVIMLIGLFYIYLNTQAQLLYDS